MKSDVIIIGGGASGLMAAYQAATCLVEAGEPAQVTVLEKMPRPARKLMITGKGRCNFTNVKPWNDFAPHVRSKSNFARAAFHTLPPEALIAFFAEYGMESVVERGDRAFPQSYRASDVVDALVLACHGRGVKIECEAEVEQTEAAGTGFRLRLADGRDYSCRKLVIATGGLSYPTTGSTGDGYVWAKSFGHKQVQTFPSLTALVPKGYKRTEEAPASTYGLPRHIDRSTPLSGLGEKLCSLSLKNVELSLLVEGSVADSDFGDIDFTDGGMEGPLGFRLSRKAVKAMVNGSRVSLLLDMKPAVRLTELCDRIHALWKEIDHDPRSQRLREKQKARVLLGKLMPRELVDAFETMNPDIYTLQRKGRSDTKLWVNLLSIAKALKAWQFDIEGYVGYERAVVTAGGVSCDEVVSKTLESSLVPGLYFCGEVLDLDADTGGYNLQLAFSTGALAGQSAARSLIKEK